MRLSDIKGERTLDVIADIIEPIANIAEDEAAAALFKQEQVPEGENPKRFLIGRIKKAVPSLIKNHKQDVISILATIKGVSVEEYAGTLGIITLVKDLLDLCMDSSFYDLFMSAQNGGDSSGSAQENTAE